MVDFADFNQPADKIVSNLNWGLGCWQGKVKNVAYSLGLAVKGTTIDQVVSGALDAQYAAMGASFVSHGFPNAYIRLGWEMNYGWYPWGQKGAAYIAAFNRVAPILKRGCPTCKIIWNPAAGSSPSAEFPGLTNIDLIGDDEYANSWTSGGAKTEPGLWGTATSGDYGGSWGFISYRPGPRAYHVGSKPYAIPEMGVGSRSDGHGACTSNKSANRATFWDDCDDPVFLRNELASARSASFIGYWDYNAGDYNSEVSSGKRPGEAAVLIENFGSANLQAVINEGKAPFTAQTAPAFTCVAEARANTCHFTEMQTGPSRWSIVVWAGAALPSATLTWGGKTVTSKLYRPATGTNVYKSLGAVATTNVAFKGGDQFVLVVQQ